MKIFSKEKYFKIMKIKTKKIEWIEICDKKSVEECNKMGFLISDDWCVEVEDEK